jgi:pyruvate/2-oxoglutarate dehydrogenase complex dihydrolipoamide acyltransferase (E2) component
LSRDQAPKEEEMSTMGEFFGQLEKYDNLEPSIIRTTKIHKVLKAIVKLASIPKDEELGFKRRSADLLEIWNKRMEGDGEPAQKSDEKAPETNGEAAAAPGASEEPTDNKVEAEKVEEAAEKADEIEEKVEQKMEELAVESKDGEKPEEPTTEEPKTAEADAPAEKAKPTSDDKEVDGDVSMMTAPEEQS